jgi:hypothetical protein
MAYLGLIIATLSMLVIVLMGWQIFNIIDLRGLKNEIKEFTKLEGQVNILERDFVTKSSEISNKINEIRKENISNYNKSIHNLEKLNKKYFSLCIEIKLTKGIIYENINKKNSVGYYLFAIEAAIEIEDDETVKSTVKKIFSLLKSMNDDEAINIMKSIAVSDIVRRMRKHKNYDKIMPLSFKEYMAKIEDDE